MPSASRTPWDGAPPTDITPAQALVAAAHRAAYDDRHARLEGEGDFFNRYERRRCPRCGSGSIRRHGSDARGVRRWLCRSCGRTFTPATGTIFEGHRIPASDWCEFVIQLLSYDSLAEVTRSNRRSPTTAPYWLAKLFLVLEGVQDGTVLSGRVQIDETFYPVPASEVERGASGRAKPGFSRNKICIAAATDGLGRAAVAPCGRGKPSGRRALAAYGPHIEPGSTLVHDMENAHNMLVRELGLTSEAHDSRTLRGLPDGDNPLRDVNRLHFLLKAFLDSHKGFDRSRLQGWLDLFSVTVNPPEGAMAKAAMVLDRAMWCPKTLRYREYYDRSSC